MIQRIKSGEVKTIYVDLLAGLGYYCHRPGKAPFICLSNSLLDGSDKLQQEVYRVLLEHHRSIPINSIFRLFTLVKYYEALIPVKDEVVIVGRAIRRWNYTFYEFTRETHIIGSLDKTG